MNILHTESSSGWGGQEIRILREAEGMRDLGHTLIFGVQQGGGLVLRARKAGFLVYEIPFSKGRAIRALRSLVQICQEHKIDLVNTHSSLDAWLGGIAARCTKAKIVRTRHLSTPVRKGLNSRLLYRSLADFVVTTSSCVIEPIARQAGIPLTSLCCIPTGIDPSSITTSPLATQAFRASLGVAPSDFLVGSVCFVRSWKGILDLFQAASLLKSHPEIKWVIIGGGYIDDYRPKLKEMGLEGIVTFTGHLESPFDAIASLDLFTLLSTAHEGISQASLQAAYLERPLLTTSVGGLPEVCIPGKTGILVPPATPTAVAEGVLHMWKEPFLRSEWGKAAKALVLERFTWGQTLKEMESVYKKIS